MSKIGRITFENGVIENLVPFYRDDEFRFRSTCWVVSTRNSLCKFMRSSISNFGVIPKSKTSKISVKSQTHNLSKMEQDFLSLRSRRVFVGFCSFREITQFRFLNFIASTGSNMIGSFTRKIGVKT